MNAVGTIVPTSVVVKEEISSMKENVKTGEVTIQFSQVLEQLGMEKNEAVLGDSGKLNKLIELLAGINEDVKQIEEPEEETPAPNLIPMFTETVLVNSGLPSDLQQVNHINHNSQIDLKSIGNMKQQLADIISKVEVLLSDINNQADIRKVAPKILELLKQWTGIESQLIHNSGSQDVTLEATSVKVNQAWNEILLNYQNRSKLTTRQLYPSESQVTSKDVVKWIEHALQNQPKMDNITTVQAQDINFPSTMSMSKVEQYIIYINQNHKGATAETQLIEQFQQVMKTSKFLSMPNGVNQLSIALRPDNLGEMMVRLVEVNGEMTVKIVVTSQAAKEMLESNMSQLRHMFSPQQVVIERQDLGAGQSQTQQKDSDEQSLHSQNQNQNESDETNHQGSNPNENDFEAHLEELLQNVKV